MYENKKYCSSDSLNINSKAYCEAMRYFSSAVHVIATDGPAGRRGVTVSACCSLCADPPTLCVCLMRHNNNNSIFVENGFFSINTLSGQHKDLSNAFGGVGRLSQEERFAKGEWFQGENGTPILKDALISFDCKINAMHEYETHYIFIASVQNIYQNSNQDALIYLDRQYHELPVRKK